MTTIRCLEQDLTRRDLSEHSSTNADLNRANLIKANFTVETIQCWSRLNGYHGRPLGPS